MDRAQAHTLEAFVAALLIVGALMFALQATAVTPLSASTSSQHIENQQRTAANDVLATGAANGDLTEFVLHWNPEEERFNGSGETEQYPNRLPEELTFGDTLEATFGSHRIAYNVYVAHHREGRTMSAQRVVYMGSPSDNAVSATRSVALYNDSTLTVDGYENRTLEAVGSSADESFYAENVASDELYNLVEVRLVVWRM
ncbi:DUF7288 family protein [Haloparvum sedimenti]|uniref:DUF7288 family protein n=1 Tax=Haloparvum sedimenti TaxID=1678448 RepID=UPI00071E8257|nr:hypothetical protein [Haloparvum sedimenti]